MVAYRKLVTPDESSELRGFLFPSEKKFIVENVRSQVTKHVLSTKKGKKRKKKENRKIEKKAFPHFHRTDSAIHR